MRIMSKGLSSKYKKIIPCFQNRDFTEEEANDFVDACTDIIIFMSDKTKEMIHVIINNHIDKDARYQELEDDLIKVLFYEVIRTKNNDLLMNVCDLWFSVLNEAVRLSPYECNDNSYSNNPAKNCDELIKVFIRTDIYVNLRNVICNNFESGVPNSFYNRISLIRSNFEDHINGNWNDTDFNGNIPLISAFTKFGNIDNQYSYIKGLISEADSWCSGAELLVYRKALDQIKEDIEKGEGTIYEKEPPNIDVNFEAAFNLVHKEGFVKCTLSQFNEGFDVGQYRPIEISARNKSEAGKIIKMFNIYHFILKPRQLLNVQVILRNSRKKYKLYKYREMRDDVRKAENEIPKGNSYRFKSDFENTIINGLINIFANDDINNVEKTK